MLKDGDTAILPSLRLQPGRTAQNLRSER